MKKFSMLLLLLPMCGAWLVPPYINEDEINLAGGMCGEYTFEDWIKLYPAPIYYDEGSHSLYNPLAEEAEEVPDYEEPDDVEDEDYNPYDGESTDPDAANDIHGEFYTKRKRRSASEEDDSDELDSEEDMEEIPENSEEEKEVPSSGENEDNENSEEEADDPHAFLKLKQKKRNPNQELLYPGFKSSVTLKNYREAPMSFFITVSSYDDEDSPGSFGPEYEFFLMKSCWREYRKVVNGECKKEGRGKKRGHRGHGRRRHRHHRHGRHHRRGHHHHRHSEEDPEKHFDDYSETENNVNVDESNNYVEVYEIDLSGREGNITEHNTPVDSAADTSNTGNEEAEGELNLCDDTVQGYVEGLGKVRVDYTPPESGCIVLRAFISYPLENGTLIVTPEANQQFLEHFDCVEPNPLPVNHNDNNDDDDDDDDDNDDNDSSDESNDYYGLDEGVAHSAKDSEEQSNEFGDDGSDESNENYGGNYGRPTHGYNLRPRHRGKVLPRRPQQEPEYDEEEHENNDEDYEESEHHDQYMSEHPRNWGRYKRSPQQSGDRFSERMERQRQRQERNSARRQQKMNRRRNRMRNRHGDTLEAANDVMTEKARNRRLLRERISPGAKFCCKEGILHKKLSTYQNFDGTSRELNCEVVPAEVTIWGHHRHEISSAQCSQHYTECCLEFDLDIWQRWTSQREERRARRQQRRNNRANRWRGGQAVTTATEPITT